MRFSLSSTANRLSLRSGSLHEVRGALAGSVFISFTGQILLAISGVLVARILGPEDRGKLALIVLVPVVVGQLVVLGLPLAVTYFTASGVSPRRMVRRIRLPIAAQVVGACVLGAAAFVGLAEFASLEVGATAVVALLMLPGGLLLGYGLAVLQGVKRFAVFNALRQSPAALYVLGVICIYSTGQDSVLALVIVWSGSYILAGLVAFGLGATAGGGTEDAPQRRTLLRFGLRGFIGASSPIDAYRLDQLTVAVFLSYTSLGLYVVGLAFTNLPQFIAQSIGLVAYPHIASMRDKRAAWRATREYVLLTFALCTFVCAVLIIVANQLIVMFFGEAFASAAAVTRVLLIGTAIVCVRRVLGDAARGVGMPGASSIAEIGTWLVLLPALAICVPLWGLIGVAVALTVSYGASLGLLTAIIFYRRKSEGVHVEEQLSDRTTIHPINEARR